MSIKLPPAIAANIEQFTGRTWLLPKVLDWYGGNQERMLLVTGGPGTGKSMIMAWLAGHGPMPEDATAHEQLAQIRAQVKATHFCIAASGTTAPKALAQNLAQQLTRNVPGFADALTASLADLVTITPVQKVEKMERGASLTGVQIGTLNLAGLGEELSFNRTLREPLKTLYQNGHDKPLLILVDALDEALTYTGTIDIVRLLAKLDDLPEQVRFLVTSRPDPRVLKHFRQAKRVDLIEDAPPDVDDVQAYASGRLAKADGVPVRSVGAFADRIAKAAGGIFLYAAIVLDELLPRLPSLAALDLDRYPLPDGLSGLYYDFVNRELGQDEDRWYERFKPVLGLTAVAQGDGLTRTQLAAISGQEVEQPLRICKQYLSGELPEGPFRVFHQSFSDFLLEDDRNLDYHIDAPAMHQAIADYFLAVHRGKWQECKDRYALAYTVAHLAQTVRQIKDPLRRDEQREKLAHPLSEWGFLEAKAAQLGVDDLVADLDAATALGVTGRESALDLPDLLWVLEEEGANLAGWDQTLRPAFLAQQVYNRSKILQIPSLARAAEARLNDLGHPYLALCWRVRPRDAEDSQSHGFSLLNRNTLSSLAVTADGRLAISAHLDSTLKVWDTATGRKIRTLTGHKAPVLAVALAPDGLHAVSGSQDGTVRVWSLKTGRVQHTLTGHEGTPFTVRITPDGQRVVSRADDGLVQVWELASGQVLHAMGRPTPPSFFTFALEEDWMEFELPDLYYGISEYALAVTPDSQRAIAAFSGGFLSDGKLSGDVVKVWDLETGLEVYSLSGHKGAVFCVDVTPDSRWAVSASDDHTAKVWDLETGHLAHTLSGHTACVQAVAVTPDSRRVLTASEDGTVKVWELGTGRLLRTLTGLGGPLSTLAPAADGRRVIAASFEGVLTIWSLDSGQELAMVPLESDRPQIAATQEGDLVLAGVGNGNVYCLHYVETDRPGLFANASHGSSPTVEQRGSGGRGGGGVGHQG
jgi:WD40 repeat protein